MRIRVNDVFCYLLGVFERAYDSLRTIAPEQKEERAMLLEEWKETERNFGEFGDVAAVQKKLPRKVKRKRPVTSEDGTAAGYVPMSSFVIESLVYFSLQVCSTKISFCCFYSLTLDSLITSNGFKINKFLFV